MTDTPTADSWLSSTEEYVLDDEAGDVVPTAECGLSPSEEYDLHGPPGPTAEYPPAAAGDGDEDHVTIPCGCGEFAVKSPDGTITIDVVCPECGNHFGQDEPAEDDPGVSDSDDGRTVDLRELEVSYWVVAEAVGRALDVTPKGIDRRGDRFAILYDAEVDG